MWKAQQAAKASVEHKDISQVYNVITDIRLEHQLNGKNMWMAISWIARTSMMNISWIARHR